MPRRRRNRDADDAEVIVKMIFGGLLLVSLALGGVTGFGKVFGTLVYGLVLILACVAGVAVVAALVYFFVRRRKSEAVQNHGWAGMPRLNAGEAYKNEPSTTDAQPAKSPAWTAEKIEEALGEIDWYQFEKFCSALLRSEGFTVERKGGAQPDGGVDLIASQNGECMLVQCKHWRTWTVQERVIRELLGSMTHFQTARGALYVLKGATRPAEAFAEKHAIQIVNGSQLAARARARLEDDQLSALLNSRVHHCPKCESSMIWRTGNFTPFWGCSTYPRCRGTLKHSGAR